METIQAALAVFLISLGLGQLISTGLGLWGASLVGTMRRVGYGLGLLLLLGGSLLLPHNWHVLWWTLPAGLLVVPLLMTGGALIAPPPHPNYLFKARHPAHAGCVSLQIPNGNDKMPGLLLTPPTADKTSLGRPAVCIIPGAGDTKTSFKWRLVQALLAEGLTVLTIDPPGHGHYRHHLLSYPDCLTAIPAAVAFLRQQPGVTKVGILGISMGGAMALKSLAEKDSLNCQTEAMVLVATPPTLNYTQALFYREAWNTCRAPILSLLGEISIKQILQSWNSGGYRSQHSTSELITLLNPLESIRHLKHIPMLLVYSHRDRVAPLKDGQAMHQAVPQSTFLESKKASHVALTLMPEINQQIAHWLRQHLEGEKSD